MTTNGVKRKPRGTSVGHDDIGGSVRTVVLKKSDPRCDITSVGDGPASAEPRYGVCPGCDQRMPAGECSTCCEVVLPSSGAAVFRPANSDVNYMLSAHASRMAGLLDAHRAVSEVVTALQDDPLGPSDVAIVAALEGAAQRLRDVEVREQHAEREKAKGRR